MMKGRIILGGLVASLFICIRIYGQNDLQRKVNVLGLGKSEMPQEINLKSET